MKTDRICIYPKDVQRITGRSERYGRKLIADIKIYFGKQRHQFITAEEFAEYSGLNLEKVEEYLLDF